MVMHDVLNQFSFNVAFRFPYQLGVYVFGSKINSSQGNMIHKLLRTLLSTWVKKFCLRFTGITIVLLYNYYFWSHYLLVCMSQQLC
jgi:hypothetical protein